MDNFARVRVIDTQLTTDPVAPVAGLNAEVVVAEAKHERMEDAGRVLQLPAFGRTTGPAEAWEAGNDAMERHGSRGVAERVDDLAELVKAAWPAMNEEDRNGVRRSGAMVDEMDVDAFQLCGEVIPLVD